MGPDETIQVGLVAMTLATWLLLGVFMAIYIVKIPFERSTAGRLTAVSLLGLWGLVSTGLLRRMGLDLAADLAGLCVYTAGAGMLLFAIVWLCVTRRKGTPDGQPTAGSILEPPRLPEHRKDAR